MLIVGAKGFAKEVLEVLYQNKAIKNLVFYDDVSQDLPVKLFDTYSILKTTEEVKMYFGKIDNRFTLGLGNPFLRKVMHDKFISLGGLLTSTISTEATIANYKVIIGAGSNILQHAVLSSSVTIGICTIVYFNAVLTHDVNVGNFVEISPGASLLGRCSVGDFSQIGSHATILPDVVVGSNVIVAAGAVVTKNIPDNCMVAGVPAVLKKQLKPLFF